MNKDAARRLLDKTFNGEFDINQFKVFIKELFNEFIIIQKEIGILNEYKEYKYKEYIESAQSLGVYTDNSKKIIEVFVVKLKKSTSRDRARTMQRNFMAKVLANGDKDAALVAFYGDDPKDWRFSFVQMEYQLKKDESGKVKVKKELTPAKRYSFLVGVNEPNHTCRKQFLELVMEENANPSLEEIEKAFSIDNVTKEFFEEYKKLYLELKESLEQVIGGDDCIKKHFEDKSISTVDFSKKLLGQIVFIYFLQKKGWLGVGKDAEGRFKEWGSGPKDFLRKLFEKKIVDYNNFFNDILEPLFYEALAENRVSNNDYYSGFKCKIPFLNGGLFEPINGYMWKETEILIDNSIFEKIFNTFDRFNFTVKEDEPLEKEVAVDPEMLGKVFENLLEVKDRKSMGAFYTPREIVHYMCQQSLINYLETNTGIQRQDIEIFIGMSGFANAEDERNIEKIKKLNDEIISARGMSENIEKEFMETINKLTLPNSIFKQKEKIDKLLKEIKIVDPAAGSGAFLVGMMNEIVKARNILTIFFDKIEQEKRTEYNLKREAIENCLYGVDIDSSAVDIAKLRFWLSLIVDEEDIKQIKPLPNLDYKIMCGNSLLEEFEGVKLFDEKLIGEVERDYSFEIKQIDDEIAALQKERGYIATGKSNDKTSKEIDKEIKKLEREREKLKEKPEKGQQTSLVESESQKKIKRLQALQNKFINEPNKNKKKQYAEEIDRIEWELIEETLKEQGNDEAMQKLQQYKKTKSKPFFLWKLYFSEVFQRENPGFDVVIANPPYVRQEEIKEYKEILKRNYKIFASTSDLYTYFYEKGIILLREYGTLTFISSNKFMRAKYGIHLRNFLKHNTTIREVIDFGTTHMFEAITNTSVVITKRGHSEHNKILFSDNIATQKVSVVNQDNLDESAWTLAEQDILELKSKIEKKGILLKDWNVEINRGLLTGLNEAFVIDTKTKERLCKEDPKNKEIIKPIIRGRDIGKYFHRWNGLWVIFIPWHFPLNKDATIKGNSHKAEERFKVEYQSIYKHIAQYKTALMNRNKEETGIRYEWYALQRWAADYYQNFAKEKIIWIELTDKNKFAYSSKEEYVLAGAFLMTGKSLKYLLSLLNSKLCKFYFKLICNSSGMGTFQWKKFAVEKIPIPKVSEAQQNLFIQLVDQILFITKDDDYLENPDKQAKVERLEKEIDQLVYKLYELTPEEIKIVEEFNSK
ncbi:MAG: hypothetical protein MSIBF_04060 [Candidatus Altiarchaeales archaeon IMC4]|nr:MAG: hypothetical protein MSIBF_04060 [Candidatus Altiarchaeales archaeon IMC4]